MSGTRPIPISSRGRASPPHSSGSRGGSPDLGISHSCPVHAPHHNGGHHNTSGGAAGRYQPPRAPFFGSLPEPSFLQLDDNPMPELLLPPPARDRGGSPPIPSVVQFASSCPVDIGFLRQGNPVQQHTWTPSPRALDEFDLSKSPALAVMSAAREGRAPMHNFRRVGQQQQQQDENRHRPSSSSGRRDSGGFYTELMGNLSITEEEQLSDDSAEFAHHHSYSARRDQEQQQEFRLQAPSQPAFDQRERRGSYGSLSDNGDGGVFLFEES